MDRILMLKGAAWAALILGGTGFVVGTGFDHWSLAARIVVGGLGAVVGIAAKWFLGAMKEAEYEEDLKARR